MTSLPLNIEQDTTILRQVTAKTFPGTRNDTLPEKATNAATPDTFSVCRRNSVADVTYYDQGNAALRANIPGGNSAILILSKNNTERIQQQREILLRSLKNGEERPVVAFHSDWSMLVILISFLLFTLVKTSTRNLKRSEKTFPLKSADNHDSGGLFHWQSTIMNLVSFLVLALFCYNAASIYGTLPAGFSGLAFWGICLGVLIVAFTLRHAICLVTGRMSGQSEAFNEYLAGIYQSYHLGAVVIFILVILVSYTFLLSDKLFLITGIATIGLMFLWRVIRLMIIFLNRNISIFYLILYLCALEILPVAVAVRYVTGLV
jgi:hypothetical protein